MARFPKREAQARRTREAIVAAAGALFSEHGYEGTTMRAIADRAGVSLESVNLAGPKRALLEAAFELSFSGAEGRGSLAERAEFARIFALPTDEALNQYVVAVTTGIAASAAIWNAVRSAADGDEQIARMFEAMLARRRADLSQSGGWLLARGVIAQGDADRASATLSVLVSHEVYEHLVGQFGWSLDRYQRWVREAIDALVAPAGRDAG